MSVQAFGVAADNMGDGAAAAFQPINAQAGANPSHMVVQAARGQQDGNHQGLDYPAPMDTAQQSIQAKADGGAAPNNQ